MSKREKDLKHLQSKLIVHEERLATLRTLAEIYAKDLTLGEVERKIEIEIGILEYCLKRDRINHGKPE